MNQHLIDRLVEEWAHLDPVDPLRGLISDVIAEINKQPAQRQWVGLTGEDFDFLVPYCGNDFDLQDYKDFARAIEAKLKEKNT